MIKEKNTTDNKNNSNLTGSHDDEDDDDDYGNNNHPDHPIHAGESQPYSLLVHNGDDDYIDYSCSTSIERLARDVETILHMWHVDEGSDRHFSTTTTTTSNSNINSSNSGTISIATTATTTTTTTASRLLLRTHVIKWNISFYYCVPSFLLPQPNIKSTMTNSIIYPSPKEKVHCDLELRLDLWDGPPSTNTSNPIEQDTTGLNSNSTEDHNDDDVLPYSLQRQKHRVISNNADWFTNFSTLFGIGQHITLTPVHPNCFFMSPQSSLSEETNPNVQQPMIVLHNENDDDTENISMPSKYSHTTETTYQSSIRPKHNVGASKEEEKLLHPSYQSLLQYLTCIILHNQNSVVNTQNTIPSMILSSWLQTAFNIAVSHCDCQIPIFGFWGTYSPHMVDDLQPSMTRSFLSGDKPIAALLCGTHIPLLPDIVYQYDQQRQPTTLSGKKSKPTKTSNSRAHNVDTTKGSKTATSWSSMHFSVQTHISGHVWSSSSSKTTSFTFCTIPPIPNQQLQFKWNLWGDVLQQQFIASGVSISSSVSTPEQSAVHLCQAKHIYVWKKQRPSTRSGSVIWHALSGTMHQHNCDRLMVRQWRSPDLWIQPSLDTVVDPVVAKSMREYIYQCHQYVVQVIEQALGRHDEDDEPVWGPNDDPVDSIIVQLEWSSQPTCPLLTLPLQSRHNMSPTDWEEMVDATESAILDPYHSQKSSLNVLFDPDVAHATLATTQRCILAAMIRTATLPKQTLVSQLYDTNTIRLWDNKAGNRSASKLCNKAKVDKATRSLVAAMDWQNASVEMIERYEAETIVRHVLNGNVAYGFPSPPDNIISILAGDDVDATYGSDTSLSKIVNGWKSLRKSAPPGRLLSLLFLQMGRVRSPSSMALVWNVFVDELRRRLDSRESLPNMNYIPGLDPPLVEPSDIDATSASRSCFLTVGTKAHLAALVNSTEPDPDDRHCLIGQKLQVFNLCLEAMTSSDMRQAELSERRSQAQQDHIDWDGIEQSGQSKSSPTAAKTLLNGSIVDGLPLVDDTVQENDAPDRDDSSKSTITQEFYDAMDSDLFVSPSKAAKRIGARCPIQGLYLTDSGDQMYAPYLQRPYPLTDDVIAERLLILSRQNTEADFAAVQQRLQITHHYQKPKLLSDMSSFKAANPAATFDDFTKWYGNPGDSLPYLEKFLLMEAANKTSNDTKEKNWIQALEVSKKFWQGTWADANAVAAIEQEPLFDAESTVEVALDFLENVHPATLLGQVVAVNLAMSYFIISTSKGETTQIPLVQNNVDRLYTAVDKALQQLSSDATKLIENAAFQSNDPATLASESSLYAKSIAACSHACEVIAATEFIISRAKTLLHKLPKQYDLIGNILAKSEASTLPISDESTLSEILNTIAIQQQGLVTTSSEIKAKPALRQYILRNGNDALPWQLSVQTTDEGSNVLGPNECSGCTVIAMTRTTDGTH